MMPPIVTTSVLQANWWLLALRGLAAALFGVATFIKPELTLFALVVLFGIYGIVNGILTLILAFRRGRGQPRWWALVLEGAASLLAGILTMVWPNFTLLGLLFLIAAWAIVTGILQIVTAIRLRKQITGEWILLLTGLLSVAFGAVMVIWPGAGALAISWLMGSYIFTIGIILGVLAFRLRRRFAGHEHTASESGTSSSSMTSTAS